jgi:hypothetical protein
MIKRAAFVDSDREGCGACQTPATVSPPSPDRVGPAGGGEVPDKRRALHAQVDGRAGSWPRVIPVGAEFDHADGGSIARSSEQPEIGGEISHGPRRSDRARRERPSAPRTQPVKVALQLHREFVMHAMAGLRRASIAVWMAMFNASRLGTVEIGQRRLAEVAGLGLRHVGEAIRELEGYGLVVVERRGRYRAGGGETSAYRIFGTPTRMIEKRRRGKRSEGGVTDGSGAAGD